MTTRNLCAWLACMLSSSTALSQGCLTRVSNQVDSPGNYRGVKIALSGFNAFNVDESERITFGSYAVDVFDLATNSYVREIVPSAPAFGDLFGCDLDVDGNQLLVGARGANAAYLFNHTTGSQIRKIVSPPTGVGDFGYAVAINGNRALVSAPSGLGRAYIFSLPTGTLLATLAGDLNNVGMFGNSVDLSSTFAVVRSPNEDAVYVYNATSFSRLHKIVIPNSYNYYHPVATSGNLIAIGDPQSERVHVFDATSGSQVWEIEFPDSAPLAGGSLFGSSLSMDGNLLLVGSQDADFGVLTEGAAYLYDLDTGQLLRRFGADLPGVGHRFGYDVAISAETMLFGAPFVNGIYPNSGIVYSHEYVACIADYNRDCVVDVLDFLDFLDDYSMCDQLPSPCGVVGDSDINGDTLVDILDFLDFMNIYSLGC